MASSTVRIRGTITSGAGQVNGEAHDVAGQAFEIQTIAPAALLTLQISLDKQNWVTATDLDANSLSSIQSVYESVRERPKYARFITAADGSAPRLFAYIIYVLKETD